MYVYMGAVVTVCRSVWLLPLQFVGVYECCRHSLLVCMGAVVTVGVCVWVLQPQLVGVYGCCRHSF